MPSFTFTVAPLIEPIRTFESLLKRIGPPWLHRTFGQPIMQTIGRTIDDVLDRSRDSVRARFPRAERPDALAYIGRERRIRRGPDEAAATYAARLLSWWEDHRRRGNPHVFLEQLHAYFRDTFPVDIELVYHAGTRFTIDTDGEITADAITWSADGTTKWSQVWVIMDLSTGALFDMLVDDAGDTLVDDAGDALITDGGELGPALTDTFRALLLEWQPAHVPCVHVVLFHDDAELWDYPQPIDTWDSGGVWQVTDPITFSECEPGYA